MRLIKILAGLVVVLAVALFGTKAAFWPDLPRVDVVAKYANAQSQFLFLPSGAVAHVRDEGRRGGTPVFLLHGSTASLHTWSPWVRALGHKYRLISIDLPGHGLTGAVPDRNYSVSAMARFVDEVAGELSLSRFVVVGNSMGGSVAMRYALDHPEKVRALGLISSGGYKRDEEDGGSVGAFRLTDTAIGRWLMRHITPRNLVSRTMRLAVADPDDFMTDEMIDRYWELLRMEGAREAITQRLADYRKYNASGRSLEPRVGGITAPTLIMWGTEDRLTPLRYGRRFAEIIPNSRLVVYNDVGHLAMEEIPERSADDMRRFLESLPN